MWKSITSAPEGVAVMTKIDDGDRCRNEQVMVRQKHLWFCNDGTYVYYQPTHWRELTQVEKLRRKNEAEKKAIDALERAMAELQL